MRRLILLLVLATALAPTGCGSQTATPSAAPSSSPTASPTATPTASPTATPTAGPAVAADTVWLCRPGLADNPCESNLSATVMEPNGKSHVEKASLALDPPIDCFYVYPTVSHQPGMNANLHIDPEERAVAIAQAARFSQFCRVYAPMYPQLTLAAIAGLDKITFAGAVTAYQGVDSAFRDYLANDNHGRGIVFIGHSQGALMLRGLLRGEIDPYPERRKLLVSALLMGANVTVRKGDVVGGDFQHIPACQSARQTGCVLAYSSFDRTPPANAVFGRVGSGLDPFEKPSADLQVLCVNPAAPGGGTGTLEPYFPTHGLSYFVDPKVVPSLPASTPFVSYPDLYSAHCKSAGGITWLQVDRVGGSSDHRPTVSEQEGRTWGLHLVDVNLGLGNLVDLVREESAAYPG